MSLDRDHADVDSERDSASAHALPGLARTDFIPPREQKQLLDGMSEPHRLHPSSVIFEIISNVRRYIVPAVIGIFGAAQGAMWGAGIAGFVFVGSLVATLFRYFTLRYRIQNADFVVTEGLLFHRVRSVPIRRIQNVDLIQNPLHRAFGVAEVRIETAAGTEPEATLRVLTQQQIEELRSAIFGAEESSSETSGEIAHPSMMSVAGEQRPVEEDASAHSVARASERAKQASAEAIYSISVRQLVLAGLASNRGMILLGILVGFYFQGDFDERVDVEALAGFWPQALETWQIVTAVSLIVLTLFLLLRLLGVAWYLLRFYDYRLTRRGDDLRISCGLLTRVSATIPRKRVQFISVHRPFLMRWLRLASVRIETAGGAGDEGENAATSVSRRWFLPVFDPSELERILYALRPGADWQSLLESPSLESMLNLQRRESKPPRASSAPIEWHGLSPLAERRLLRVTILVCLLIALAGLAALRPWGFLAGPIAFPGLLLLARKKSRARKYARTEWGIAYQSGWLTRKLSFAFYDRIQTLEVSQSPFDRRWKMARLSIDTAAAGPAEHTIDIGYLEDQFAFGQFDDLQKLTASHRPTWA